MLAANDADLATVALRPRLIWGPGDTQILPRLVARARAGRLRLVGDGRNKVDTTYIDNAAQAHFDALEHLAPGASCAGKAYFVSNGEPMAMGDLLDALLAATGTPPVRKTIAFETGLERYEVRDILDRLQHRHGVICYDADTRELFIINWLRNHWNNSPKWAENAQRSIRRIKSRWLRLMVRAQFLRMQDMYAASKKLRLSPSAARRRFVP